MPSHKFDIKVLGTSALKNQMEIILPLMMRSEIFQPCIYSHRFFPLK